MKARLLLLTCCLLGQLLAAQGSGVLLVEPAEVTKELQLDYLDEDFEDITSVAVTNNSGRTIQLVRETVARRQPSSWSARALDRDSRATPYVLTQDEQDSGRRIRLAPGQTATFYVVIRPDGVAGTGVTDIRFSDASLPGTVLGTASIQTIVAQRGNDTGSSEAERPMPTVVRLYPNPAVDNFFVEAPRNVRIGRVEVTNTLGRQLRAFTGEAGKDGYDIEDLPNGLYLISVYDETGKKVKTLRLLHRRFGA